MTDIYLTINHCCSGKAISVKYSVCVCVCVCVCVALVTNHEKRMGPIVICGLTGCSALLHIFS